MLFYVPFRGNCVLDAWGIVKGGKFSVDRCLELVGHVGFIGVQLLSMLMLH